MEHGQLRLLAAPQPLVERLGEAFFRTIPREPGVYRMYDAEGVLVYVGKAGDLRARLGSYRRTAGQSRKTIRLIHTVRRIEWQTCLTETAARLAENDLIRRNRPKYNRAGVWPKSARYVRLVTQDSGLRLELVQDAPMEGYGPFRGGPGRALAAMTRLLWLAWTGHGAVASLPRRWVVGEGLRAVVLEHPEAGAWVTAIRQYLDGIDDALVGGLVARVPDSGERFDQAFVAAQFEVLEEFFRRGPLRLRRLRDRFGPSEDMWTPERLDDLTLEAGPEELAPPFRPGADGTGHGPWLANGAGIETDCDPRVVNRVEHRPSLHTFL